MQSYLTELYGAPVRELVSPFYQSGISDNFLGLDSLVGLEYDHYKVPSFLFTVVWIVTGGVVGFTCPGAQLSSSLKMDLKSTCKMEFLRARYDLKIHCFTHYRAA